MSITPCTCVWRTQFPKAGETIDGTQGLIGTGGKGANQAGAASRLAHADQPVAFACRLGKDDHADLFHRGFQELCPRSVWFAFVCVVCFC